MDGGSSSIPAPRSTPVWVKEIFDKLVVVDKKRPELPFLRGSQPPWVERIMMDMMNPFFSKAKIERGMILTPQALGEIIGKQGVLWLSVEQLLHEIRKDREKYFELRTNLERQTTPEQFKQLGEYWRVVVEEWRPGFRAFVKEATGRLLEEEMEDWVAFCEGLSKSEAKIPVDPESKDFPRTTTRIYFIMMVNWRVIGGLRSVRELHEWLRRVCGSQVIGELKRVEKMCQRIGLSFGKPGRPRKSEIQTEPPAG
jgi:hypothetical protein